MLNLFNAGAARSSQSVREAADRLRGEYARLQQTINQNQDAQTVSYFAMISFSLFFPFVSLFAFFLVVHNGHCYCPLCSSICLENGV